jgi:hypothetical protein
MNVLMQRNSFPMHRQPEQCGGILKLLPGNKNRTQFQEENRLTKLEPTRRISITGAGVVRRHPFQNDVICARGRTYWDHPGNQFYRKLISLAKNQYSKARNRLGKSLIVSEIIRHIHQADGRFVKKVSRNGGDKWVECNINFVREKVTQSLRDGLAFKYSSSTERKRQRKAKSQEVKQGDIDRIVHSNKSVSRKIRHFKQKVEWVNQYRGNEDGKAFSDETILKIFETANLDILETMKKDPSMLEEMHRVMNNETVPKTNDMERSPSPLTESPRAFTSVSPESRPDEEDTNAARTTKIDSPEVAPFFRPSQMTLHSVSHHMHKPGEYSCDDMELDLDSPFMFLDDITRHKAL